MSDSRHSIDLAGYGSLTCSWVRSSFRSCILLERFKTQILLLFLTFLRLSKTSRSRLSELRLILLACSCLHLGFRATPGKELLRRFFTPIFIVIDHSTTLHSLLHLDLLNTYFWLIDLVLLLPVPNFDLLRRALDGGWPIRMEFLNCCIDFCECLFSFDAESTLLTAVHISLHLLDFFEVIVEEEFISMVFHSNLQRTRPII